MSITVRSNVIGEENLPWFDALVELAGEHAELLSGRDLGFLETLEAERKRLGGRMGISPRQHGWLEGIERRLKQGGAEVDPDLTPIDSRLGGGR